MEKKENDEEEKRPKFIQQHEVIYRVRLKIIN